MCVVRTCDWKKIGELANVNHALLQDLSVSCSELDTLVIAARDAGALGAKMSGTGMCVVCCWLVIGIMNVTYVCTGRGGLMWAICADEESQDKVHTALKALAPQVWKTKFA